MWAQQCVGLINKIGYLRPNVFISFIKIYKCQQLPLAGQSTSTPFVSKQGCYGNNRRNVSFDTKYMLDNQIDKLTSMMSKLSTQSSNQNRPFKPKIYQGRMR